MLGQRLNTKAHPREAVIANREAARQSRKMPGLPRLANNASLAMTASREGTEFIRLNLLRTIGFLCLICLSGCTTLSQHPAETALPEKQTSCLSAMRLHTWDTQGRIAVKTNQKGWNASFNWSQKQAHYDLSIFGPLGSNRISLVGNREYVSLITNERTYESNNAETLLQQQLGWCIPVDSIYYWIRGLPAPGSVMHIVRNAEGQVTMLDQQGWHIEYQSYDKFNGLNLPILIQLQNPRASIRIAIHQWMF